MGKKLSGIEMLQQLIERSEEKKNIKTSGGDDFISEGSGTIKNNVSNEKIVMEGYQGGDRRTGTMGKFEEGDRRTATMEEFKEEDRRTATMEEFEESDRRTAAMEEFEESDRRTATMEEFEESDRRTATMEEFEESDRRTATMEEFKEEDRRTATMESFRDSKNSSNGNKTEFENGHVILTNEKGNKHYRIYGEEIARGEGGTADIYRVYCEEEHGKKYVAKIYAGKKTNKHIDELIDEIDWEKADGLIRIYDRGFLKEKLEKRRFYIIPDYSSSLNLEQYLEKYDMSDEEVIDFIRKMSEALHVLHNMGYYHRDIKPRNILYGKELNGPILIDYGSLTKGNINVGKDAVTRTTEYTEGYTAPEIWAYVGRHAGKEVKVNEKTDLFSLGVVIGEIYSSMQYRGDRDRCRLFQNDDKVFEESGSGKYRFPSLLEKNKRIHNLVCALFQYDPKQRPDYVGIKEWLDNGKLFDVDRTSYVENSTMNAKFKYPFHSITYTSEEELARAMAQDWNRAVTEIQRGTLRDIFNNKFGIEQKNNADRINDIYDYYEQLPTDISRDGILLEVISLLGKGMPFAWKGSIYETNDGNTDFNKVADNIYEDAISGGTKFDTLVKSRSIKELLYPQIRFVDEFSSRENKEKVHFDECMANIQRFNEMAQESVQLAKFYLVELCHESDENQGSYIITDMTGGKIQSPEQFLSDTFTSDNIDSAIKNIYTGIQNKSNPVIRFMEDYMTSERIKAVLIKFYNMDYVNIPHIEKNEDKIKQLFDFFKILSFCDEKSNNSVNIKENIRKSKYVKAIYGFLHEKSKWVFVDLRNSTLAKECEKEFDKSYEVLTRAWNNNESHKAFREEFLPALMEAEDTIKNSLDIFVYDRELVNTGLILATKQDGAKGFVSSAIVSSNENSNLCLVDGTFLLPKCVAEEFYGTGKNIIATPNPQEYVRKQSIEVTDDAVTRFYNNFKSIAGDEIEEIMKYGKGKLICDFIIAAIVVLSGVGLFLSGIALVLDEIELKIINEKYTMGIIIVDFLLGGALSLGCYPSFKDARNNLKLYKNNHDLLKRMKVVESTKSVLNYMKRRNQLSKLDAAGREIVEMACSAGNGVKKYFQKYKLKSNSIKYKKSRTGELFFVAIVNMVILIYNHIPVRDVLGAMLENNISVAADYAKKGETLPVIIKSVNKELTKVVLWRTEDNAKSALIDEYNMNNITREEYIQEKDRYLSMCEDVGYSVDSTFKNALNKLDVSKKAFKKGLELNKKGKTRDAVYQFINVIEEDSHYFESQKYVSSYIDKLYEKQQKYIEVGKKKKLNKLAQEYKNLLEEGLNSSTLSDIYDIISGDYDIEEISQQLVAYQIYQNKERLANDDISKIACVQSDTRGRYYVCTQRENSGLSGFLSRYETNNYIFYTYGYSLETDVPDTVKFNLQEFNPDSDMDTCLELLKN